METNPESSRIVIRKRGKSRQESCSGSKVRCELDTKTYPKGIKVSDAEMATLNIKGDAFHPEWNYTISLRSPKPIT
jgi:hypothetical protein